MCQKFILQKERQVFIKCILRNVHNSYVFVHIGRRYCGCGTVTPSTWKMLDEGPKELYLENRNLSFYGYFEKLWIKEVKFIGFFSYS